jgi:hypothetical protein
MSDDYNEYEERPPVPTFSDGTYTNRGAKLSAHASRMSASKNASAVASRASVMMMASMQQLKNSNVPIVNSRTPVVTKPPVNKLIIQAAEKRAIHMINHIHTDNSVNKVINTVVPVKQLEPIKQVEPDRHIPIYVAPEPVQVIEVKVNYTSEIFNESVSRALSRKKVLLESYEPIHPKVYKNTTRVNLVQCKTLEHNEIDPSLISTLSVNLLNIITLGNNHQELIDEFNEYKLRARILVEEAVHKKAVEMARINKDIYFTSDT